MFFSHFSLVLRAFPKGKRSPENIRNLLPLTGEISDRPLRPPDARKQLNPMIQTSTKERVFVAWLSITLLKALAYSSRS